VRTLSGRAAGPGGVGGEDEARRLVIFDCRSSLAAVGNALKGKGTELASHYAGTVHHFLDIGNIHTMRASIDQLHGLLHAGCVRYSPLR
jgi:hypothetical protein